MISLENIKFAELTAETVRNQLLSLNQLVFEVTDGCNLKCKYCGYGEFYCSYDERTSSNLSVDKAKRLIDYIFFLWKESGAHFYRHNLIVSFYGGEPLLNIPFIKEIQDYLETNYSSFLNLTYSMTTNALLLDRYMDYLVEKDFHLLISLDGDKDAQSYRVDFNGNNSFDRVYRNVKLLQEKYPDYFQKRVNFNSVLHDRNSVSAIYDFMKREFGKKTMISELNSSGIREEKKQLFAQMFLNRQKDFYRAMSRNPQLIDEFFYDVADTKMLYTHLKNYTGNIYKEYTDLLTDRKRQSYFPTGTCLPFQKKLFLTVNGKILPCERIDQKNVLGWVDDNGVTLDFEYIASFYNQLFGAMHSQCATCYRKSFCPQCVFYIEGMEEGIKCQGFMNKNDYEAFVANQEHYLRKNPQLYKRIVEELTLY